MSVYIGRELCGFGSDRKILALGSTHADVKNQDISTSQYPRRFGMG
jgi:hypothetical protein